MKFPWSCLGSYWRFFHYFELLTVRDSPFSIESQFPHFPIRNSIVNFEKVMKLISGKSWFVTKSKIQWHKNVLRCLTVLDSNHDIMKFFGFIYNNGFHVSALSTFVTLHFICGHVPLSRAGVRPQAHVRTTSKCNN